MGNVEITRSKRAHTSALKCRGQNRQIVVQLDQSRDGLRGSVVLGQMEDEQHERFAHALNSALAELVRQALDKSGGSK